MFLSRQQKFIIITLIIYWPALFIFAHIPIPELVRQADVSDKYVHFLAYLILTFLLWVAAFPDKKVNWRKPAAWWIILVVVLYGVFDEVLQSFVAGRSCDIRDFIVDLAGTLTGLILLSFFSFQPALVIITGITIFGLTNVTRANIADLLPLTNTAFNLCAYAIFTLGWIHYLYSCLKLMAPTPGWLIKALTLPAGFLLSVKLVSLFLGRSVTVTDVIVSAVGIAAAVGTTIVIALFRRLSRQKLA
ncbi:MAG: hypothetical protein A2167_03705 [Planctomycetes bacterium RBG_13_46_10]|nr:MAG: hypothetical protein A2167_03705 [Planctomycetes bacterium RBG_13_46_10]